MFFKIAKKTPNIWATLERKFVIKSLQKSTNLVTLDAKQRKRATIKATFERTKQTKNDILKND